MLMTCMMISWLLLVPEPTPPPAANSGAQKAKPTASTTPTPEQTLRTFLAALIDRDEATLRAVTLPSDDLKWLLSGQIAPPNKVAEFKAKTVNEPILVLKPGDEVPLSGDRKFIVGPADVTADRAMLLPKAIPLPIRLQKVKGKWLVDAAPLIAGRKAAETARQKKGSGLFRKPVTPK